MQIYIEKKSKMIQLIPYPFRVAEQKGQLKIQLSTMPTVQDWLAERTFAWLRVVRDPLLKIGVGAQDETYRLEITPGGVVLTASADAGAFYGYLTLLQLLHNYKNMLPCMTIEDRPRYAYRGLMLDCGRYYFSPDDVKKIVDMCVLHKINTLHWHLTEDQGWRIEIKRYPLLATKGSERSHTNFGFRRHSGFYSQREIREIVEYCKQRHITVIPEIDMPGHIQSALACYPYLGCFNRNLPVATHWGVKHDVLCAGKETTYRFLYDVLDEVCELFDSPYIHLGGDECPKMRWELCPHCQEKMRELGLETEDELQSYFTNRIAQYLATKNRTAIVWNETVPTGRCDPSVAWQLWHVGDRAEAIAEDVNRTERKLIFSLSDRTYLDFPYKQLPVKMCYESDPVRDTGVRPELIVGMEASVWTEYIPDLQTVMFKALPRLGALCEVMWSPSAGNVYENFLGRLNAYYRYLGANGLRPAPLKRAFPKRFTAWREKAWFDRRPLHWHGLHNLIDDMRVRKLAKRLARENPIRQLDK